ncbi:MAG TPA: hydroxymethylbilane synthase [Solirubrobacteraceae bacterium]|nr:hydroxymethylbilane synthase [Solirubrobacteraceae bacterium]
MRVGTRGSALAMAQTRALLALIGEPDVEVLTTAQLAGADRERHDAPQDKSRWVADLERALLAGKIDLAVHSAKDVPGDLAEGLELIGALARAPAIDLLVLRPGACEQLPRQARVGTGSLRRSAQLRAWRPDIEVVTVAGNVDTRLAALTAGAAEVDALVLAAAGLQRLGIEPDRSMPLRGPCFVPAPGQGTITLQARCKDRALAAAIAPHCDRDAFACLRAERALARALGASCDLPLGAHAQIQAASAPGGAQMRLRGWVGLPDGSQWIADQASGDPTEPEALGMLLAERMRSAGCEQILRRALAEVGGDV